MEELMRLAFIEGYKQRALSGGKIFDETSKMYADALFDKWIDKGRKLPIHNVIGQSEQLKCSGCNKPLHDGLCGGCCSDLASGMY